METLKDVEGKGRYLTKGIDVKLDKYVQLMLWTILNDFKRMKLQNNQAGEIDPFQIFELELDPAKNILRIKHKQEQPLYEKDHVFFNIQAQAGKEYSGKIYVVDNELNGMTMMWSNEY